MEKILFDFKSSKLPWVEDVLGNREVVCLTTLLSEKCERGQSPGLANFKCRCGQCENELQILVPEFSSFYPHHNNKYATFSLEVPKDYTAYKNVHLGVKDLEVLIAHLQVVKEGLIFKSKVLNQFLPIYKTYSYKDFKDQKYPNREFKIMVRQTPTEMQYILLKAPIELTKIQIEKAPEKYEEGLGIIFTEKIEGLDDDKIIIFRSNLIKKLYWPKKIEEWIWDNSSSNKTQFNNLITEYTSFI